MVLFSVLENASRDAALFSYVLSLFAALDVFLDTVVSLLLVLDEFIDTVVTVFEFFIFAALAEGLLCAILGIAAARGAVGWQRLWVASGRLSAVSVLHRQTRLMRSS